MDSATAFAISIDPRYPTPRSAATLSVSSTMLDLANATMTVSIAGKEIYRGSVRPVALPLGNAGSITKIAVTIRSGGTSYTQTLSLQPQDVVLVAEPVASTPPLYPGKPSVPIEGMVRIVAMTDLRDANGTIYNPSSLSYAWTVDDTHIANASGIGKRTIIVSSPLEYRSRSVTVAVQNQDGTLVGGASLSLTAQEPLVRIYRHDPLLGILYSRALSGGYPVAGAEDTLYAAPFSFPISDGAPVLQWFLNGETVQTGRSITLRPSGSGKGTASLSLVASSGESAKAIDTLLLSFGTALRTGLFGL